VPLETLGAWEPGPERADPVAIITAQETDRLRPLLPVRHARMLQNAFGFYRGAPAVLAADLAAGPRTGLEVQLCGDAHLLNFGLYGSPERALVFDVNDFDETLPGPFEWDVKRLMASLVVAARGNGFSKKKARAIALASARSYRDFMRRFAGMDTLTTWYTQMGADKVIAGIHDPALRADAERTAAKATSRDAAQAAGKLTVVQDGKRTIVPQPPLIVPFRDLPEGVNIRDLDQSVRMNWNTYRHSLHSDVIKLLSRYELQDLALKVVGVGSVGTRCFIGVFTGRDVDDVLFLQVKEAGRSVLEPYLKRSRYKHQGERVVAGQRLTQSASDIFLGWSNGPQGGTFYWRQLRDWKGSVNVDTMDPAHLLGYGELCAWTLAKGHARSGDPAAIAAYLGKKDRFDVAMADFAEAYATQNEADYAAMKQAAEEGRIEVAEVF
jgi:predicted hotdog family 3-hydroxylacyl-ACP dehydratase